MKAWPAFALIAVLVLALAPQGRAAEAAPFTLVTLGTTGGPLPRADRAQMASLLDVDGEHYLIDAGDGVARRLVQAGVDTTKVGRVFITHPHGDHTAGLATLLSVAWQYGRHEPIQMIGPPGVDVVVQGALAFDKADEDIRTSETRGAPLAEVVQTRVVGPGEVYKDAHVRVTAVENTHFQFAPGSAAYGKYRSYSYRFDVGPRAIVFTGDTGPSQAVTDLAKGADILVSEATASEELFARMRKSGQWDAMTPAEREAQVFHMTHEHITPEQAGEMAAKAGVKTLVLSHLAGAGPPGDDYARFAVAAAKAFHGKIIVAKDLMRIEP